jgi:hypothetical protein
VHPDERCVADGLQDAIQGLHAAILRGGRARRLNWLGRRNEMHDSAASCVDNPEATIRS